MTEPTPEVWQLVTRGGELVAELEVTDTDMFWSRARVVPGAAFSEHAQLFADEAAASDAASESEDWSRADQLYLEIRDRVVLRKPDGQEVPEFLLHLDDQGASWRYSDEPFDE